MSSTYKFICEKCNYKCNYKSIWNKHCGTELHKTGKRKTRYDKKINEKCPDCDHTTASNTNMKQHKLNYHSTEEEREKQFKHYCKLCKFGTFAKKQYDNHLNTKKHKIKFKLNKSIIIKINDCNIK